MKKLTAIFAAIKSDAFWKERLISGFMVAGYILGNGIEYVYGKVSDDPPAIWIFGIILGLSVIISSVNKNYRKHTSLLFKFFLLYLNFNIIYAYGTSIRHEKEGELFYLLFSYLLFVLTSQGLDSRRELVIFTFAEVIIFAGVVIPNLGLHPLFAEKMQLFMFLIVLSGNYMISTQRMKLTQIGYESNIQFKVLTENARDAQMIFGQNKHLIYTNPATTALTGFAANLLQKKNFSDLMILEDYGKFEETLGKINANRDERISLEYRLQKQDGNITWVESIFSSFLPTVNAKEYLIFAETRDIEERKKLEAEVQKQLEVEEMLIKHSNQFINVERTEIQQGINVALGEFGKMLNAGGAFVYRVHGNLQDEFISANQWFKENNEPEKYFNKTVKIGQPLITFLRSLRGDKAAHGDYVSAATLNEIGILNSNEIAGKELYIIPLQSGNVVGGFVIFIFTKNIGHAQSSFFGLIGNMIANAFTRLRTEIKLHEAQQTNEFILRALPDWLYIVDKKGEFTGKNSYSTLPPYIPEYDLTGTTYHQALPENVVPLFTKALGEVIESDLSVSFEYLDTTRHKGRYFKVIIAPFKANEYLLIIRDVTDLRMAQQELENKAVKLERSNEELEEFAYVVSHDMKQPIRTIISYLSLIKKRYGNLLNEEGNEFLTFSIDGANKMSDLIRDILQYSRMDQQLDSVTEIPLEGLVKKVLQNLNATITTNNADVTYDTLPLIKGNETMLSELFQNLIENGIKYNTNQKRTVNIHTFAENGHWKFEIKDNGIGFEQEYAEQIFKIFKRLHTDEEFQGTGIGLSICQKVIEKHGGKIWAVSEKGKGSTFHFTLPRN